LQSARMMIHRNRQVFATLPRLIRSVCTDVARRLAGALVDVGKFN
jgi:hypothetical protein